MFESYTEKARALATYENAYRLVNGAVAVGVAYKYCVDPNAALLEYGLDVVAHGFEAVNPNRYHFTSLALNGVRASQIVFRMSEGSSTIPFVANLFDLAVNHSGSILYRLAQVNQGYTPMNSGAAPREASEEAESTVSPVLLSGGPFNHSGASRDTLRRRASSPNLLQSSDPSPAPTSQTSTQEGRQTLKASY